MPNTMHSFESSSSNVPAFLVKLWKLVEDPACNDLIAFTEHGTSFVIRDQARFSKELLPQYFKHNNMASFIRQLNMYGFRKMVNYDKSSLRNENDEMEFMHSFFCKGQSSLLEFIKRKIPNTKVSEPAVKSNARDILTDLSSIREKQENMDGMLLKMKQENELLWRELTIMRKKHSAQEQIIKKVIQFLVSIVQQSNQNIGVKRKIARMLHDNSTNKGNSQVSCAIDVLRKKNPNFISVDGDKLVSPLGPVIHEITEFEHEQEEDPISPTVKSPESGTVEYDAGVIEGQMQEIECPINIDLSSPIDTSLAMEPLSILEPLQQNTSILNIDECNLGESILGMPLECLTNPIGDVVTIPQEQANNVISLPETSSVGLSYDISTPDIVAYSSENSDFDDSMSESLQTPKIPTIHIEDVFSSPAKPETKKKKKKVLLQKKSNFNVDNEHNYQLALSDLSVLKPSTLTKNGMANHLINVEEDLQWLTEQICSSNSLNIDAKQLLNLFSTDDVANNEVLAEDIVAQSSIKSASDEIIGKELVQYTPMSDVDLDIENNQFFECLNQYAQESVNPEAANKNTGDQRNYLLVDVLNNADQAAASEAAEFLLNNESTPEHKSPRRPKTQKLQKVKKRKVK